MEFSVDPKILEDEIIQETFIKLLDSINDVAVIDNAATEESESHTKHFQAGIASLLLFIQHNFTGPTISPENKITNHLSSLNEKSIKNLFTDSDKNENVSNPECLYFSKLIFSNEKIRSFFPISYWWSFRTNFLNQQILDEPCPAIFEDSENLIEKINDLNVLENEESRAMFYLELAHFYMYFKRPQSSEKYLKMAENVLKMNVELKGGLGKRTKFQAEAKAQLFVSVELGKSKFSSKDCEHLPKDLPLYDEMRLESIDFLEGRENMELGALEESAILTRYFHLKLSQPKDNLVVEEIRPYLATVLENTQNWSLKMSSLYQRSILESDHRRTVERTRMQLEVLIDQMKNPESSLSERMDLFFSSGLKPIWLVKKALADVHLSLGESKCALDLYLNLRLWEDVIVCYTILQLKHKATEIIEQELSNNPTVKLWCLLGDFTGIVEHYETAWALSGEKSSRAQRHWGLHYYSKAKYAEAIPHLELSVKLNNIQENVWSKLGYAALQVENWALAATAYRHYCSLEQTSFEVWNNLAKAYIKMGDKKRAWHCLHDAVKFEFNCWEVWDNLMVVSIDLGYFSEALHCYERILEIKGKDRKHEDIPVLEILTNAIVNEIPDAKGEISTKFIDRVMKLFGHLTSTSTNKYEIWTCYGAIAKFKGDQESAIRFFTKGCNVAILNSQTLDAVSKALDLCCKLGEDVETCVREHSGIAKKDLLFTVRSLLQKVAVVGNQKLWKDQELLASKMDTIEEKLKIVKELEASIRKL